MISPPLAPSGAGCGGVTRLPPLAIWNSHRIRPSRAISHSSSSALLVVPTAHNASQGPRSHRGRAGVRVVVHGDVAPGHGHAVPGSVGRRRTPLHEG
eukprot:scaffold21961_cov48-Phaeocystis_antarctica.AAC.1